MVRTPTLVLVLVGCLTFQAHATESAFSRDPEINRADLDGDGVPDFFDSDDDGDGVLDLLDKAPLDANIVEETSILPWINEFLVQRNGAGDSASPITTLTVEVGKRAQTSCTNFGLRSFDRSGELIGNYSSTDGSETLFLAEDASGRYRGELNGSCQGVSATRGYDFIYFHLDAETFEGITLGVDPNDVGGVYLEVEGRCVELVSFQGGLAPLGGVCDDARTHLLTEVPNLSSEESLSRSGVGIGGNDFRTWYIDDRPGGISSGSSRGYLNHYQKLVWQPWEIPASKDGTLEFATLELPRPRDTEVKALMDSGWAYPIKNGNNLKIFRVTDGIKPEYLEDDGESTYIFVSEQIRPDFLEFLDFMLGKFTGFMGGVRAENYFHHFDFPEASKVLNEIAFRRGNLDARPCSGSGPQPQFFSQGSGGGYYGASEDSYQNGKLLVCVRDDEGVETPGLEMRPRNNFDASFGSGGDFAGNLLGVNSEDDLAEPAEFAFGGGPTGTFRDNLIAGHMHEWAHNWENFQTILYREYGPFRHSHPVKGWANSRLFHGSSIPFELYVREYLIDDREFDGREKLWSLKKYDNRNILETDFHDISKFQNKPFLDLFRAGDQGVEVIFFNYLIKNFGLEKLYSEYYRRRVTTGDFRVALHQTYGKPMDELFKDAANWAKTVESHEDFRLLFDSAEAFTANLNQSFNVSFLQARNSSTPNNRFQTLYTFVGEGSPSGVGSLWIPVTMAAGDSVIFSEGTEATVGIGESGQLTVNGHAAYFYRGDSSVFHVGGLAESEDWSAFTRRGERTSDLWFPVFIYDHDEDGLPDDYDPDYQSIFFTEDGRYKLDVWPDDPAFSATGQLEAKVVDIDGDGEADESDPLPFDPTIATQEALSTYGIGDEDKDGVLNKDDLDDDNDGLSDVREVRLGTDHKLADSDGDGLDDGVEVERGLDPLLAGLGLARLGPNSPFGLQVAGSSFVLPNGSLGEVPSTATAASLNITVVSPDAPGFITVWPCGLPRPLASNINFEAGSTIPNGVIASLGSDGAACLYSSVETDIVVDLAGWFDAEAYQGATPTRLVDTRDGTGAAPGLTNTAAPIQVPVAGLPVTSALGAATAIPDDVGAVAFNVTAVEPTGPGFVTVWPCEAARPNASNLNFAAGDIIANGVIAPAGSNGVVCAFSSAPTHMIVDLAGWFPGETFTGVTPTRLLDTRDGGGAKVSTGGVVEVATRRPGFEVPSDAAALSLNVTVTGAEGPGFITVWPCDLDRPNASNVNYVAGQTIANNVMTTIGASGKVCAFASAPTHVIVDIAGWVNGSGEKTTFSGVKPTRVGDTRTGQWLGSSTRDIDRDGVSDAEDIAPLDSSVGKGE